MGIHLLTGHIFYFILVCLALFIQPCELFVCEVVSIVIELRKDILGLLDQCCFFRCHTDCDALTDQLVIRNVIGEEVVSQFQSLGHEALHVLLDILLLITSVENLVPEFGLLRSYLLVLLDLLDMANGFLCFLLALLLDKLTERLRGFQREEFSALTIEVLRLCLKLLELLSIVLTLSESNLVNLGIQLSQLLLLLVQYPDATLVLLNQLVLGTALGDALKGICQQGSVGVVGVVGGVINLVFLLEGLEFFVKPCYIFSEVFWICPQTIGVWLMYPKKPHFLYA